MLTSDGSSMRFETANPLLKGALPVSKTINGLLDGGKSQPDARQRIKERRRIVHAEPTFPNSDILGPDNIKYQVPTSWH